MLRCQGYSSANAITLKGTIRQNLMQGNKKSNEKEPDDTAVAKTA